MKRIFENLFFVVLSFTTSGGNSQPIPNGLIAYYPFNGNAKDSSGNGNHGTVYVATLTNDRCGNPNSAYLFNGMDGVIQVPNSTSLETPGVTNAVTQTAWIYLNGLSLINQSYGPIIMKSNVSPNQFMYRLALNYTSVFAAYNNYFNAVGSAFTFNLHTWYFVASTFDGSVGKTYVNGILLDSVTLNTNISLDHLPLEIGRDVPGIIEVFNGAIDDVTIHNRALSDSEINVLYRYPCSKILPLNFTLFTASNQSTHVELVWHTENEINTDEFIVERSADKYHFSAIGNVKSKNATANSYRYYDNIEKVEAQRLFYRLKQLDKDGRFSYSKVLSTKVSHTPRAAIYPNPVETAATIKIWCRQAESVSMKVVNSVGQTVYQRVYSLARGNNLVPVNTESLPRGLYTILLTGQNTNEHLTFQKE